MVVEITSGFFTAPFLLRRSDLFRMTGGGDRCWESGKVAHAKKSQALRAFAFQQFGAPRTHYIRTGAVVAAHNGVATLLTAVALAGILCCAELKEMDQG